MNPANPAIKSLVVARAAGGFFPLELGGCHGPSRQCCCCCWISGQLCLFLWQLCLLLGELFSPSVTLPAAPPPPTPPPQPPPPPPSPRRPSLYPTHWVIRILMSFIFFLEMIFHCVFFPPCRLPASLLSFPSLYSLFLFLLVCSHQCDQVQVIPIPSVCIIVAILLFSFVSAHHHPQLACGHRLAQIKSSVSSVCHAARGALPYAQMANAQRRT